MAGGFAVALHACVYRSAALGCLAAAAVVGRGRVREVFSDLSPLARGVGCLAVGLGCWPSAVRDVDFANQPALALAIPPERERNNAAADFGVIAVIFFS